MSIGENIVTLCRITGPKMYSNFKWYFTKSFFCFIFEYQSMILYGWNDETRGTAFCLLIALYSSTIDQLQSCRLSLFARMSRHDPYLCVRMMQPTHVDACALDTPGCWRFSIIHTWGLRNSPSCMHLLRAIIFVLLILEGLKPELERDLPTLAVESLIFPNECNPF